MDIAASSIGFGEAVLVFEGMFLTDALLATIYPQSCRICGDSVERRRFGVACEGCWARTQVFTNEGAIGWYEGALRETVLLLKREPHLPRHVGDLLIEACQSLPVTRIVPVPLYEERLRSRGFNQAAVIGREISRAFGLPLDEISLVRVSSSEKHRTGLDAKGRWESVANAFVVRYPRLIAEEDILLVDDVFTTGATVSACQTALLDSGAKSVLIFTLAKARR